MIHKSYVMLLLVGVSTIILWHLFILLCTCSLKFKDLFSNIGKYFKEGYEATLSLLEVRSSDFWLPVFQKNIVPLTFFGLDWTTSSLESPIIY